MASIGAFISDQHSVRDCLAPSAGLVRTGTCVIVLVLTLAVASSARTLIVAVDGTGHCREIQPAIDEAVDGDLVLVMPGEYLVAQPITFFRKAITVRGDGGPEVTVLRSAASPDTPQGGSVLVFQHAETPETVLQGFTITGATDSGIRCTGASSPTLIECWITSNEGEWGGGIHCTRGAAPRAFNCRLVANSASEGGGAISCRHADAVLTDCTMAGNSCLGGLGGAIYACECQPTIEGCDIVANWSKVGGAVCAWGSDIMLSQCTIQGNAAQNGGVVFGHGRCGRDDGGCAVSCEPIAVPKFFNCLVTGNRTWLDAAVLVYYGSQASFINCTIADNDARLHVIEALCDIDDFTLRNCIVWGNSSGYRQLADCHGEVSYCNVDQDHSWWGIDGNISADPLFVQRGRWESCDPPPDPHDPTSWHGCVPTGDPIGDPWARWIPGDYRLYEGSPSIDAGTLENVPSVDIDGNGRPCAGGFDMGAYEMCVPIPVPPPSFLRMDTTSDGQVDILDVVYLLSVYLFGPAETVACPDALDADDDGLHTLSDATFMLGYLFQEPSLRPQPHPPFPGCGIDETPDDLDRLAGNNTDPAPDPNDRDPAQGSCVYPEESCR